MSLIRVNELALEFSGTYVLKNISCSLERNSRVGLIGKNGSGKTTLIRLMLGLLQPTSGEVLRARHCRIAHLPQNMELPPELVLLDYIKSSRPDLLQLERRIAELSSSFVSNSTSGLESELAAAVEEYTAKGGYEHDNEIKYVLTSLAFPETEWKKRIGDFSGGEQTRICLAYFLLMPHDLLILDEPTNHLDLAMITWLERYLLKQDKPFLVVSHDREFLDNTVSTIFSLREGKLSITKGNYRSFKEADDIARLSQEREFERQQKFIAETRAFIQKNIAGQKTNQAKSRLKMLARLDIVQKPQQEKQVKLQIKTSKRSGNDIYTLKEVRFGIPPELELAREVTLFAHYQDRICVIGPNGCGKTTLLKILLGEHDICEGQLKTGASLQIGYFDQHQVALDESLSVLDTIWQLVPSAPRGYVLGWLARFGFSGDEVEKPVSVLSGGETSRLYLCVLIHQNPNLLILDEPTNHLDLDMTEALLEALTAYEGTIIFVSHDRWFLSRLATKFWVFRKKLGQGKAFTTIKEPDCGPERAIELAFAEPERVKAPPPPREKKRKLNPWYLDQIHLQIEARNRQLGKLQEELGHIHTRLSRSDTYSDQSRILQLRAEMEALEQQIKSTHAEIALLEEKYLSLSYEE